jgi:tetratricopeptide (TPR) repeat protein
MPKKTVVDEAEEHLKKGEIGEAQQIFNELTATQPQTEEDYLLQGDAYFRLAHHYEQAIEYLKAASKMDPGDPLPLVILGEIYYEQMQYSKAKKAWKKALELEPRNPKGMYNLALVAEEEGQLKTAISYLEEALTEDSHDLKARELLAEVYKKARMYKKAAKAYEGAINLVKDSEEEIGERLSLLYDLGRLHEDFRNYDKAIECFKQIVAEKPDEFLAKRSLRRVKEKKHGWDYIR